MSKHSRHKSLLSQAGFTLVELVVVMGVMAVLTGIAIPSVLAWMPNIQLRNETTDVKNAFAKARSMAINHGMEYRVLIDYDAQTFQVDEGNLMVGSTIWTSKSGPYEIQGETQIFAPHWMMESETTSRPFLRFGSNGAAVSNFDEPWVMTYNNHNTGYFLNVHRRTGHVVLEKWGY
jgi:prepilin-type N-terminal cleavage/methylation domain-containing protein